MNSALAQRSAAQWTPTPGFGVYVHIPFCRHRCHYCDFNTYEGLDDLHGPYVNALVTQIERSDSARDPATSIFIGGGTPTLLAPAELGRILDAIDGHVGIAAGAEITVEANPETVDVAVFGELKAVGFNRVSLGVQSLRERVLASLGRTHSAEVAVDALRAARAGGFENVNADLIFGSPAESDDDWLASLRGLVAERPAHISAYALTVEEGTPLATLVATGRVADVDPDVQAARFEAAAEVLAGEGYDHYELSNWALAGAWARHNVLYWCAGDYLAFGAGAHGHLDGRRYWLERRPRSYIEAVREGRDPCAGEEALDTTARAAEAMLLGLRLLSGVDRRGFCARFGAASWAEQTARLIAVRDLGLVEMTTERVRLSARGTLWHSEVARALL